MPVGVWRGPDLLQRTDNARRSIDDRYVNAAVCMTAMEPH